MARAEFELGLGLMFDPNNLLNLTIATQVTLTLPLNRNLPNYMMTASELVGKNISLPGSQARFRN